MSKQGETVLLNSMLLKEVERGENFRAVAMTPGGDPEGSAIVNAVAGAIIQEDGGGFAETLQEMAQRGEKVTLVYSGANGWDAGMIVAREGTLFVGNSTGQVALKPKGARSRGFVIDPDRVLACFAGYAAAKAAEYVAEVRGRYPQLRELTKERLEQLPPYSSEEDQPCSLAIFGTHPGFTGEAACTDCVWLWGTYDAEHDLLDQGVVLIRPDAGVSESGSEYGQNFQRGGAFGRAVGEVVDFQPISFKEAVELTNVDHDEALKRLFGAAVPA
jgi:hypothetical protein